MLYGAALCWGIISCVHQPSIGNGFQKGPFFTDTVAMSDENEVDWDWEGGMLVKIYILEHLGEPTFILIPPNEKVQTIHFMTISLITEALFFLFSFYSIYLFIYIQFPQRATITWLVKKEKFPITVYKALETSFINSSSNQRRRLSISPQHSC